MNHTKNKIKSHWNYRVLVQEIDGYLEFNIHEVHYKNEVPKAYTQNPVGVGGDSIEDIEWILKKMQEALKKPVLWYGSRFPEEYVG